MGRLNVHMSYDLKYARLGFHNLLYAIISKTLRSHYKVGVNPFASSYSPSTLSCSIIILNEQEKCCTYDGIICEARKFDFLP